MAKSVAGEAFLYKRLKEVIAEKKKLKDPLIEVLHQAQEIFGYLPIEVQQFIADELSLPIAEVYGVVTFYNLFSMVPQGKHIVNICTGTACFVKGAPRLIQMMEDEHENAGNIFKTQDHPAGHWLEVITAVFHAGLHHWTGSPHAMGRTLWADQRLPICD